MMMKVKAAEFPPGNLLAGQWNEEEHRTAREEREARSCNGHGKWRRRKGQNNLMAKQWGREKQGM